MSLRQGFLLFLWPLRLDQSHPHTLSRRRCRARGYIDGYQHHLFPLCRHTRILYVHLLPPSHRFRYYTPADGPIWSTLRAEVITLLIQKQ